MILNVNPQRVFSCLCSGLRVIRKGEDKEDLSMLLPLLGSKRSGFKRHISKANFETSLSIAVLI